MDLAGKTVLLTGASSGLGPHIAARLHREGAKFILSARNEEALRTLARRLGHSRVVVADLGKTGEVERLAEQAGHVDVLVSNAGIPASGRLAGFTVEEIDRALAVNLRAGIVLTRLLVPAMARRKSGHIVFMASIAAKFAAAGATLYNATKFGLRGFGLALREELWETGVGVSVICPTFVSESGMWAETGIRANPLAGEVKPAAVADAVCSAILHNRAEVDVTGLALRAGLVAQAVAPGLVATLGRMTGAARADDRIGERQRHKR